MPGQSMGPNHKSQAQPQSQPHHHASSSSRARADDFRHGRSYSRDSANSQDSGRGDHQHPNNNNHTYSSNHHNHNHTHTHTHNHNHSHNHNHHHRSHSESRNNKSHSRHTNGRGSETLGFIPGSADAAQGSGAPAACGSCASIGWSGCKALICCILTCGFYGTREPCLPVQNESSTDNPAAKDTASVPNNNGKSVEFLESSIGAPARYQVSGVGMGMGMGVGNGVGMAVTNPTCGIPLEPRKQPELPNSDSFRYKDVHIGGKKVVYHPGPANANAHNTRRPYASGKTAGGVGGGSSKERPVSIYSREDLDLDDIDDGSGTDIDSLITKKLLELYKLHQIEQLAKCTSDSSFSRKTNEISDLIYSIAQDYNLEEQEAECRLVHGVIRISTRKGRNHKTSYAGRINKEKEYYNNKDYNNHKDYSSQDALLLQHNGRRDGTLPDSGHETMTLTSSFEPEVKVSELTRSDELARKMRLHSGRTYSSSSATVYSPTSNDTDFSGEPLLHFR